MADVTRKEFDALSARVTQLERARDQGGRADRREASKRSRQDKKLKSDIKFLHSETVRTFKDAKSYVDNKTSKLKQEIVELKRMLPSGKR